MLDRDRVSIACWVSLGVSACILAPATSIADGVCSQWDVSGAWSLRQSNDTGPVLQLEQDASEFHGTASFAHTVDDDYCIGVGCDHLETVRGLIIGTVKADVFEATIYWDDNAVGVYTGSVRPQGLIEGSTYDATNPRAAAKWHSNRFFKCNSQANQDAAGGLAATSNPPPVALGRVSSSTTATPTMTVCEAAQSARARNSPAAASLEKQCAATSKPQALGRVAATGAAARAMTICEAAQSARARNSPATPSLEAQCAAQSAKPASPVIDDAWRKEKAARGEALAGEDPLATELRSSIPEGKARDGFDFGMAVAEGHTANGPGKQATRGALDPDERFGFELAVQFSVERNAHADLAGKGAAVMVADPTVAAVRDANAAAIAKRSQAADQAVFYKLGFDIATGLFGDPGLGAAGNTAMGPGSLQVRNSLASGNDQSGFDDAVNFHLKRDYRK